MWSFVLAMYVLVAVAAGAWVVRGELDLMYWEANRYGRKVTRKEFWRSILAGILVTTFLPVFVIVIAQFLILTRIMPMNDSNKVGRETDEG